MKGKVDIVSASGEIIRRLFNSISEPSGGKGYRVEHSQRVKTYIEKFILNPELSLYNIDRDMVLGAGILHDIGDLARVKDSEIDYSVSIDHARAGSNYARTELMKYSFSTNLIEGICEIIENHHSYNKGASIETKLVQDADLIDESGILNVWQMFSFSIATERTLEKTLEYWNSKGKKRKEKCIDLCNFNFTKQYAKTRFDRFNKFIEDIYIETSGGDFTIKI